LAGPSTIATVKKVDKRYKSDQKTKLPQKNDASLEKQLKEPAELDALF